MRGEVLHYDEAQGFGFIAGADGNRYTFRREDLRGSFQLSRGAAVEFRESGDHARDVSPPVTARTAAQVSVPEAAEAPQAPVASTATPIATPASRPAPQRYGRNAIGNGAAGQEASTGLWSYFWNGITANYANFRGRARRKEYWGFTLFVILGGFALGAVGGIINVAIGDDAPDEMSITTMVLVGIFVIAVIIPSIAVGVRRIHDIGLSGWLYLLFLIPYVGYLILLVFALIPSQKRENKWGPVPDGVEIPPQAG